MNHILIAYITDDNYVIPTCVSIQSIKDSASAFYHKIKVCTFGISAENEKLLTDMSCEGFEVKICCVDRDEYRELLEQVQQKSHVTPSALLKFELPHILKQENKVLYLDSDIIVKRDLSSLFQLDIAPYYVAASQQFVDSVNQLTVTGRLSTEDYYFNSGVMLLNLEALRENEISARLWEDKLNKQSRWNLMDQDVLNRVLGGKALHLPIIYNFNAVYLRGIDVGLVNQVYSTDYKTFDELIHDVVIYHYAGGAISRGSILRRTEPGSGRRLRFMPDLALTSFIEPNPLTGFGMEFPLSKEGSAQTGFWLPFDICGSVCQAGFRKLRSVQTYRGSTRCDKAKRGSFEPLLSVKYQLPYHKSTEQNKKQGQQPARGAIIESPENFV